MATGATVKVEGLRELGEAMSALSSDIANRVSRSATNAGAQVIRKRAQALAPVATGNLRKNIIVRRLREPSGRLTQEYIVTVRKGKVTKRQAASGLSDAYYARFVEFGTVKMAARPFLRPAYDAGKTEAVDAIKAKLRDRIEKGK